jgi:hypothetical protein
MSLNMLIEGLGFDYTGADCRSWMSDTGFSESYVEHLVGPDSMVVGIKYGGVETATATIARQARTNPPTCCSLGMKRGTCDQDVLGDAPKRSVRTMIPTPTCSTTNKDLRAPPRFRGPAAPLARRRQRVPCRVWYDRRCQGLAHMLRPSE